MANWQFRVKTAKLKDRQYGVPCECRQCAKPVPHTYRQIKNTCQYRHFTKFKPRQIFPLYVMHSYTFLPPLPIESTYISHAHKNMYVYTFTPASVYIEQRSILNLSTLQLAGDMPNGEQEAVGREGEKQREGCVTLYPQCAAASCTRGSGWVWPMSTT